MDKQPPIVVIAGPTASGKTAVALELATHINLHILGADARQIYKNLNIGTATPTEEELLSVPHHLINVLEPEASYTAGDYHQDARTVLQQLSEDVTACFVGGSGLYIDAALDGFSQGVSETNSEVRASLKQQLENHGRDWMFEQLEKVDSVAAKKYSDKNPRRILRALEHYQITGQPISSTWLNKPSKPALEAQRFAITWDRSELHSRIEARCKQMWVGGIFDEVQACLDAGLDRYTQSLRTVGYTEVCRVLLDNENSDDMFEQFVIRTRQYAKRQQTWFRKDQRYTWLEGSKGPQQLALVIHNHVTG